MSRVVVTHRYPRERARRRASREMDFLVVHLRTMRAVRAFARAEARRGGRAARPLWLTAYYAPCAPAAFRAWVSLIAASVEPWYPRIQAMPGEPESVVRYLDFKL